MKVEIRKREGGREGGREEERERERMLECETARNISGRHERESYKGEGEREREQS